MKDLATIRLIAHCGMALGFAACVLFAGIILYVDNLLKSSNGR